MSPVLRGQGTKSVCHASKTRKSHGSPAGSWEGPALESGQTPAWPCTRVGDQAALPAVSAVAASLVTWSGPGGLSDAEPPTKGPADASFLF